MAFSSYTSNSTSLDYHRSLQKEYDRRVRELEERYRRSEREIDMQRAMTNPYYGNSYADVSVSLREKKKCPSCKGDEHGGRIDMIGYCEKRLEKYYKNLSKLVGSKKNT